MSLADQVAAVGVGAARPLVAFADGPGGPTLSPADVCLALGLPDVDLLLGWVVEESPWLEELGSGAGRSIMGGYQLTRAIADGRIDYLPVRLAAVPHLLAGPLRPDVAVVAGRRRGGCFAFRGSVGWAHAAARHARAVVVEVDEDDGIDDGGPEIPGNIELVVARRRPPCPVSPAEPSPADLAIGRHVASLVPEDGILQVGIGRIAHAVLASIDCPVQIRSGLVPDSLVDLVTRGFLNGVATATYTTGGPGLRRLAADGRLRLVPVEQSHDFATLVSQPRFVTVNAAVQVGLDGSVNVERSGGRVVGGIGGHADFCAAAALSSSGLSVIAVRSSFGGRSTIVPVVEVVSTPRSDVHIVVTEHGVADLRGVGDRERARRLLAVAAPEHQEELACSA